MFILQIDSSNQLPIEPNYDYMLNDVKQESAHRTPDGSLWVYLWGTYDQWKFGVSFVNSETKSIVNSWWKSNAELQFYEEDNPTEVNTVMIRNKKTPVGKLVTPYTDLFQGTIELSTF